MTDTPVFPSPGGHVRLLRQAECRGLPLWNAALGGDVKDHRYHEILADTLDNDFDCRALAIYDHAGTLLALQPCFLVEQDLLATVSPFFARIASRLRRKWPRLLRLRMLMAGCAAGEGPPAALPHLPALIETLPAIARAYGASLVVWKDVPAEFRPALARVAQRFPRVASMPATRLAIDFASFDEYLARRLSHSMRKNLRRKFRATAAGAPVTMTVSSSLGENLDDALGLYLQVFARSSLRFEKLNREFLLGLEREMPDRVRFFLWHQAGELVAFSLCFVHDGVLYDEYLGLDYRVALDLHLYFVTFRDLLSWAITQGLREYRSTPLSYEPKLHLGFALAPLDLYVTPALEWARPFLRLALPFIQPTRAEPVLREFPDADQL